MLVKTIKIIRVPFKEKRNFYKINFLVMVLSFATSHAMPPKVVSGWS